MESKKTNQEQFEADYLAIFPTCSVDLRKLDLIDEYIHPITGFAYQVWLQQAKRHEAEISELVEALTVIPEQDSSKIEACRNAFYNEMRRQGYRTPDIAQIDDEALVKAILAAVTTPVTMCPVCNEVPMSSGNACGRCGDYVPETPKS